MLSARSSWSSCDSPAAKALESSARRANALKTSPHFPQRTWPPAVRNTSADNLNTVSHFEHCVYTLDDSPSVDAAPVIALNDSHNIKSAGIGGLYRVGLSLEQSGQQQVSAGFAGRGEYRRQLDQGTRENIGHDTVSRPQR